MREAQHRSGFGRPSYSRVRARQRRRSSWALSIQLLFTAIIGIAASALAMGLGMAVLDHGTSPRAVACTPTYAEPSLPDDSEMWAIKTAQGEDRAPRTEVRMSADGFPAATTDPKARFKSLNEIRFGTPKRIQSLYWWLAYAEKGDVTLALPVVTESEAGYVKHWIKKYPDLRVKIESYFQGVLDLFPEYQSELLLLELKPC